MKAAHPWLPFSALAVPLPTVNSLPLRSIAGRPNED
jgi:hypothetical protein